MRHSSPLRALFCSALVLVAQADSAWATRVKWAPRLLRIEVISCTRFREVARPLAQEHERRRLELSRKGDGQAARYEWTQYEALAMTAKDPYAVVLEVRVLAERAIQEHKPYGYETTGPWKKELAPTTIKVDSRLNRMCDELPPATVLDVGLEEASCDNLPPRSAACLFGYPIVRSPADRRIEMIEAE